MVLAYLEDRALQGCNPSARWDSIKNIRRNMERADNCLFHVFEEYKAKNPGVWGRAPRS